MKNNKDKYALVWFQKMYFMTLQLIRNTINSPIFIGFINFK
jgi:hypothetical protein